MSGLRNGSKRLEQALRDAQAELASRLARIERAEPADVHETRVAARRLRSMLKTFGLLFAAGPVEQYRSNLRQVARLLGEMRTLDVTSTLAPLRGEPFAAALRADRIRAHRRLQRRLRSASAAASIGSVMAAPSPAELGLEPQIETAVLLRRVRRTWRRSLRRIEGRPRAGEPLHKLRIELKHTRYSLDSVIDIATKKSANLHRQLRAAQQLLGELRDAEAAIEWLDGPAVHGLDRRIVARARARLKRRVQRRRRTLGPTLKKLEMAGERWDEAATDVIRRASRDRSSPSPGRRN